MKARRILVWAGASFPVLLLMAYVALQWQRPVLDLGVGYGARVACACRYIGNRALGDCYKDFEPGMEMIRLSEDASTKTVTASVPLTASRSVTFDPVLGCQPEAFDAKR